MKCPYCKKGILSRKRLMIYNAFRDRSNIPLGELATGVCISQALLCYHIKLLTKDGLLQHDAKTGKIMITKIDYFPKEIELSENSES